MAEDQTTENAEGTAAAPGAAEAAPAAEPQEVLAPKERRQRARAAKASKTKARAVRTGEERQTDRVLVRPVPDFLRSSVASVADGKA